MSPSNKERYLVIAILGLFIFLSCIKWITNRVFFDEAVYLSIARFLITAGHAGYLEALRPLALPVFLAPFTLITAHTTFSPLIIARLVTIVLTLVSLILLYFLLKKQHNSTALWTLFLFTTSTIVFMHTGYILTDVIAYILGASALYITLEKHYLLASFTLALAFLFKFPLLLLSLPCITLYLIQNYKEKTPVTETIKKALQIITIFLLTITPFLIFNITNYQGSVMNRILYPFTQASSLIEQQTWIYEPASITKYFLYLITQEPVIIFICICTLPFVWKKNKAETITLLTTAILFLLYFSLRVPRYDPRYMLSSITFLIILAAMGLTEISQIIPKYAKKIQFLIIITSLFSITLFTAITLTPEYEHNSSFAAKLASLSNQSYHSLVLPNQSLMLTNNPVVFSKFTGKAQMLDAQNQAYLYTQYQKQNEARWLALDLSQLVCTQQEFENCQKKQDQTISILLSNNPIVACGYLYGFPIVLLAKREKNGDQSITPKNCLDSLHRTFIPPSKNTVEIRLNEIEVKNDATINNQNEVERLIPKIQSTHTPLTVVIKATNSTLWPQTTTFIQNLPTNHSINLSLGVLSTPNTNTTAFIKYLEQTTNQTITSISPFGDDWTNYQEPFPQTIQKCHEGAWLQTTLAPIPCSKIDLYTTKNWSTKQIYNLTQLQEQFEIQRQQDNAIIIDIWAPSLNNQTIAPIESFIEYIASTHD